MRALTHTKCNWLCLSVDQVWLAVSDDHLGAGEGKEKCGR